MTCYRVSCWFPSQLFFFVIFLLSVNCIERVNVFDSHDDFIFMRSHTA